MAVRADATGVLAAAEPGPAGRRWMPPRRGRCGVLATAMDDAASGVEAGVSLRSSCEVTAGQLRS